MSDADHLRDLDFERNWQLEADHAERERTVADEFTYTVTLELTLQARHPDQATEIAQDLIETAVEEYGAAGAVLSVYEVRD